VQANYGAVACQMLDRWVCMYPVACPSSGMALYDDPGDKQLMLYFGVSYSG